MPVIALRITMRRNAIPVGVDQMTVLDQQSIETAFHPATATYAIDATAIARLYITPIYIMDIEVFEHNIVGRTKVEHADYDAVQFRPNQGSGISHIKVPHLDVLAIREEYGCQRGFLRINLRF